MRRRRANEAGSRARTASIFSEARRFVCSELLCFYDVNLLHMPRVSVNLHNTHGLEWPACVGERASVPESGRCDYECVCVCLKLSSTSGSDFKT